MAIADKLINKEKRKQKLRKRIYEEVPDKIKKLNDGRSQKLTKYL